MLKLERRSHSNRSEERKEQKPLTKRSKKITPVQELENSLARVSRCDRNQSTSEVKPFMDTQQLLGLDFSLTNTPVKMQHSP